jgi:hypothetical protein
MWEQIPKPEPYTLKHNASVLRAKLFMYKGLVGHES